MWQLAFLVEFADKISIFSVLERWLIKLRKNEASVVFMVKDYQYPRQSSVNSSKLFSKCNLSLYEKEIHSDKFAMLLFFLRVFVSRIVIFRYLSVWFKILWFLGNLMRPYMGTYRPICLCITDYKRSYVCQKLYCQTGNFDYRTNRSSATAERSRDVLC